ncbi:hypothetical protein [Variovorax sp. RCC_210]|uniref:hypothetical protein n=1 Tax=Variovorax sp. RCC_210 TaxID=3239217 RepID=UPI0035250CDF
MNFKLAAVAAAVAATLALAACGGGGGDNGASFAPIGNIVPPAPPAPPAPPPPPPPAPAPAPATNTFLYEQLPYPADNAGLLSNLNSEGAKGFMFLSALGSGGSAAHVYVKTGDATYVYELKSPPADAGAFLSQANEAGSRGFRWVGALAVGSTSTVVMLYRKDSDADATYTYRTEAPATDKDGFLAQVNAQGAAGYFNTAPGYGFGGVISAVFEKSSAGNATYAYELGDAASDTNGALAQFDEKGARGFRYRFPYMFGSFKGSVFVKDLSQSSTFSYQALTEGATLEADIVQSNTLGATGYGFVGPLIVGTEQRNYYYKPTNCAGVVICKPTSPFGL